MISICQACGQIEFSLLSNDMIKCYLPILIIVHQKVKPCLQLILNIILIRIFIEINFITKLIIEDFSLKTVTDRNIKFVNLNSHCRHVSTKIAKWYEGRGRCLVFLGNNMNWMVYDFPILKVRISSQVSNLFHHILSFVKLLKLEWSPFEDTLLKRPGSILMMSSYFSESICAILFKRF